MEKRGNKIKCICGQTNVHTIECKRHNKKLCESKRNKESTYRKVKNHLCLNCGKKVKPDRCPHCNEILKYKKRCKECREKLVTQK